MSFLSLNIIYLLKCAVNGHDFQENVYTCTLVIRQSEYDYFFLNTF